MVPELDLVWLPAVYGESIVVVVVVCMIFFPTLTLYHYVFCLFLPYMCMRPFKFVLLFCYNFSVISHLFDVIYAWLGNFLIEFTIFYCM